MRTRTNNYVSNEVNTCFKTGILFFLLIYLSGSAISQNGDFNHNYIRTYAPIKNNATSTAPVHNSSGDMYTDKWSEQIVYYDGLGREMQIIGVKASDGSLDVVTSIGYDDFGRKTKDYLPYAKQNNGTEGPGGFRKYFDSEIADYYDTIYGSNDAGYAFAEADLEASPLNRKLKHTGPGIDWRQNGDHSVKYMYSNNQETAEVYKFSVNEFNQLKKEGCYKNGKVLKNTTIDENGNQTVEYIDFSNRLVQKKAYDGSNWLRTIYVYDDFGLLRYVIPPESYQFLPSGNASGTFDKNTGWIRKYCYYYEYDDRKRMVLKRLPGKEEEYLVYNKRDQLIMTQDGNQRSGEIIYWTYFKYDTFGRQVMTGRIGTSENRSREYMQDQADNISGLHVNPDLSSEHGYSGDGLPPPDPGAQIEVFTVTFYDNYHYINSSEFEFRYAFKENEADFLYSKDEHVKGKITATKTRIIKTEGMDGNENLPNWIIAAMYYDINGNLIQTVSDNHIHGIDIVSNEVNFTGQVLRLKENHINGFGSSLNNHIIDHHFTYNHTGGLIKETHKIDDGELITLATNKYDELGRLKNKKLHSKSNKTELQKIDYGYNIRNWLTSINNLFEPGNDLFVMQLKYNDAKVQQYNGNIGSMEYKYPADNILAQYNFQYDEVSRLTAAVSGDDHYTCSYNYDKNGNITNLKRKGYTGAGAPDDPEGGVGGGTPVGNTYGSIDKLTYSYIGNQLKSVDDYSSFHCQQNGFSDDGSFEKTEYFYDANGNMTMDLNKQILSITYNHLNLPTTIVMGVRDDENIIYYLYDATGNKLRKQTEEARRIVSTTDYTGNFVYTDTKLEFIHTSEGRAVADAKNPAKFNYQYYLKDHLGNNRVLFDDKGTILQSDSYYPFGMRIANMFEPSENGGLENKYLYNGKELQDDFGLDWYDYGARFYDAQLGRWHMVDPLSETNQDWTPYRYGFNNPLRFVDPNGMLEDWWVDENNGALTHTQGNNKPTNMDATYLGEDGMFGNVGTCIESADYNSEGNSETTLNPEDSKELAENGGYKAVPVEESVDSETKTVDGPFYGDTKFTMGRKIVTQTKVSYVPKDHDFTGVSDTKHTQWDIKSFSPEKEKYTQRLNYGNKSVARKVFEFIISADKSFKSFSGEKDYSKEDIIIKHPLLN